MNQIVLWLVKTLSLNILNADVYLKGRAAETNTVWWSPIPPLVRITISYTNQCFHHARFYNQRQSKAILPNDDIELGTTLQMASSMDLCFRPESLRNQFLYRALNVNYIEVALIMYGSNPNKRWYIRDAFAYSAAGFTLPKSFDELTARMSQFPGKVLAGVESSTDRCCLQWFPD